MKYDLLRHGYRLEWLGTARLRWGDAYAILTEQPQQTSAVARALRPDDFDRSRESQTLELLAVLTHRIALLMGNQSGVKSGDLPAQFDDLFEKPVKSEADILAAIAAYEKG